LISEGAPIAAMRFGRAPGAWPFLGHLVELQRRPLRLLGSLPAYGDLVEIRLGPRPAFVLCHPELARQVLTDFRSFDRTGPVYDRLRLAMGDGLASVPYRDHRRQRLVMQPAFRHEHLRGYVSVMRHEIAAVMEDWQDGDLVDMVEEMFKLTTTVALRALFSSQVGSAEAEQLRQAFDAFLRGIYTRAVLPVAARLPVPGNRRYTRAVAHWRGQVARLIDGYRRAGAGRGDLMSRLLAARDADGRGLSDQELSDQVAVLLLAGGETTSAAVVWSLHLLTGHPEILGALQAETDAVLGTDIAGWEHLPRLDLTARVVREALRLYPPAWAIPRISVRETSLAGRTLPAGSMVVFSPYVLHRRPDFYTQPDRFDPGRWLAPAQAAAHRASFLASVAARWNLSRQAGATVSPAIRAVLVPKAFPVRLSRRQ
jgi:cytochrome P450